MVDYIYRNGQRLTPYMYFQIERLNAEFRSIFGVEIVVSSGIRLPQEQIDIFLERYVTADRIYGRTVYDTRVWRGVRYYRISSAGTVAVPGTSNHEIQGNRAAVDLRDTGRDAGVASAGNARSNWLKNNAWRFDLVPSGYGFGEPWHYDINNIFTAVSVGSPAGSRPSNTTEQEMTAPEFEDGGQRIFWPNGYFNTYDINVYRALKNYFSKDAGSRKEDPNTEGTVAREVWVANDFMAARHATAAASAIVAALKASGIPVSVDVDEAAIAKEVVARLPKYTLNVS